MKLQNFYIWLYSKRNQVFLVHVEMLVEKNHQTQLNLKALLKKIHQIFQKPKSIDLQKCVYLLEKWIPWRQLQVSRPADRRR